MNKAIEDLVRVSNELNYKIESFQDTNIETGLPRAKVLDVNNGETCFIEYEDGQWNVL